MIVLGIETSCDETGVAIYQSDRGVVAESVYSQLEVHAPYGGVVPELASRDHIRKTLPLIRQVLSQASLEVEGLDGIAFTEGPGLSGALLVGAGIGRSLAWALDIPAIGVHHMEAHLLAPLLDHQVPQFPFAVLLVSGGHTLLVRVVGFGEYEILGESLDDAAGEAFDKVAKLLELGYPGGPRVAKLATKGDPTRFSFPRPMQNHPSLNFSFSGLKTAVMLKARELQPLSEDTRADLAASFELAVVESLFHKCEQALERTDVSALLVSGGVAANLKLRECLSRLDTPVLYPPPHLCVDNGTMVAFAGHMRLVADQHSPLKFHVRPRWPLSELGPHHVS